jgi:hypothetical protein
MTDALMMLNKITNVKMLKADRVTSQLRRVDMEMNVAMYDKVANKAVTFDKIRLLRRMMPISCLKQIY